MQGLKTQETGKFNSFFSLVQNEAKKLDKVFFLENGEGRELITDKLEGEDLCGWLIPKDKAEAFEIGWKQENISDEWTENMRFAEWSRENGVVSVSFKEY